MMMTYIYQYTGGMYIDIAIFVASQVEKSKIDLTSLVPFIHSLSDVPHIIVHLPWRCAEDQ